MHRIIFLELQGKLLVSSSMSDVVLVLQRGFCLCFHSDSNFTNISLRPKVHYVDYDLLHSVPNMIGLHYESYFEEGRDEGEIIVMNRIVINFRNCIANESIQQQKKRRESNVLFLDNLKTLNTFLSPDQSNVAL